MPSIKRIFQRAPDAADRGDPVRVHGYRRGLAAVPQVMRDLVSPPGPQSLVDRALRGAVKKGDVFAAHALVAQRRANPNAPSRKGHTALEHAQRRTGLQALAHWMSERGQDPASDAQAANTAGDSIAPTSALPGAPDVAAVRTSRLRGVRSESDLNRTPRQPGETHTARPVAGSNAPDHRVAQERLRTPGDWGMHFRGSGAERPNLDDAQKETLEQFFESSAINGQLRRGIADRDEVKELDETLAAAADGGAPNLVFRAEGRRQGRDDSRFRRDETSPLTAVAYTSTTISAGYAEQWADLNAPDTRDPFPTRWSSTRY